MKKPRLQILVLITCIFAAFITGFFAGRNLNRTPVQIRSIQSTVPVTTEETAATEPVETGPVNINTATSAQLETLPGIGPVLAQRIIDYRDANGSFESVGELAMVSGIGEKRLEELWDLVTTGG